VLTPNVNCEIVSSCSNATGVPLLADQMRTLRSGGRSLELPIQNLTVSSENGADPPISVMSKQLTRSLGFPASPSAVFEQPIPFGLPEQTPTVFCRERIPTKGSTGGDVGATGDAEGTTGKAVGTADSSSIGLKVGATGAAVGATGVSVGMEDTSGTGLTVGESVV